ncbi:MAG TPA: glycosyltransferase family 9 protein, partial [Desulfuromonadaceae bacterium]|nr:glycosyltransferase family 9 protein [Desulfuromonadaceae bacterium]
MKPKLLIVELWGLGDLVIATPFLQAATERFEVTLLAQPYALDLQRRLWPDVRVEAFIAPWTAFKDKYHLWQWPWNEMFNLRKRLATAQFEYGLSARWDPRDHLLLKLFGVKHRIGFPRLRSRIWLTDAAQRPSPDSHRYEFWRAVARVLDINLPGREKIVVPASRGKKTIMIHSGAGQAVRVWPLDRYRAITARLREQGFLVQAVCDPDQRSWWLQAGEKTVATPTTVTELIHLTDDAAVFIGNDSGPGHLAAFCGVPTFTIFGPQLPEWFAPLHPRSE